MGGDQRDMGRKLDNAVRFLDVTINDGNPAGALDSYVAAASTGTAARTSQLRHRLSTIYRPLLERYDRRFVRPMRGFEDGSRVVVHSFQSFGYRDVERVVFDIFDTDGSDRIIDHLSVCAPLVATSTGRSQIDGPWLVDDVAATAPNKHLVAHYVKRLAAGDVAGAAALRSPRYTDHTPDAYRSTTRASLGPPHIFGCGNFVAAVRTVAAGPAIGRSCDLYRITDGRLTDHWGAVETVASASWTAGGSLDSASPGRNLPVMETGPGYDRLVEWLAAVPEGAGSARGRAREISC